LASHLDLMQLVKRLEIQETVLLQSSCGDAGVAVPDLINKWRNRQRQTDRHRESNLVHFSYKMWYLVAVF